MIDVKPVLLCLVAAALVSACGKNETPTTPTTTTPPAAPTTTATFNGKLPVGGSSFYSFTIAQQGTVNITLVTVGGAGVPTDVTLGLGIGRPAGTGCSITTSVNVAAGTDPQLTGTYGPGVFCTLVADIGNLPAAATFTVTIAHP